MFFKRLFVKKYGWEKRYYSSFYNECTAKRDYKVIMELVQKWTEGKNVQEQTVLLNYVIRVLLDDICSNGVIMPYYRNCPEGFDHPFPPYFRDGEGKSRDVFSEEKIEIDISETPVYVCPWNNEKMCGGVLNIHNNGFEFDEFNHGAYYYKEVNLCYVHNGNHSISAGRYCKGSKLISTVCYLAFLYENLTTDGAYWYNIHTGGATEKVKDFRFAAAYELSRRKHNILN